LEDIDKLCERVKEKKGKLDTVVLANAGAFAPLAKSTKNTSIKSST